MRERSRTIGAKVPSNRDRAEENGMKALRTLGLAAAIALGAMDAASAGPMSIAPGESLAAGQTNIEQARVVCGPYRCVRRPGWRYGYRPGWRYGYRRYGWRRW
jgi:hypothetical protein